MSDNKHVTYNHLYICNNCGYSQSNLTNNYCQKCTKFTDKIVSVYCHDCRSYFYQRDMLVLYKNIIDYKNVIFYDFDKDKKTYLSNKDGTIKEYSNKMFESYLQKLFMQICDIEIGKHHRFEEKTNEVEFSFILIILTLELLYDQYIGMKQQKCDNSHYIDKIKLYMDKSYCIFEGLTFSEKIIDIINKKESILKNNIFNSKKIYDENKYFVLSQIETDTTNQIFEKLKIQKKQRILSLYEKIPDKTKSIFN